MHKEGQISAPFLVSAKGYYYYYIYRNNRRVYRSTGETTRAKAMRFIQQRIAENDIFNEQVRKHFKTFREFAENFWDYDTCPIIQERLAREGTYTKRVAEMNHARVHTYMLDVFGSRQLCDITKDEVKRWFFGLRNKYSLSTSTCNAILSIFRQMMEQAKSEEQIEKNPCDDIAPFILSDVVERGCYTTEQVKKLLASDWGNDQRLKTMVAIAATTGMRIGEIQALSMEQIKDDHIVVDRSYSEKDGIKSTKSGKPRIVPLLPQVKAMLMDLKDEGKYFFHTFHRLDSPIDRSTALKYLKAQMDKVGIDYKKDNLGWHSFRHFFNTRLLAANIEGEKVRAVIGHENEKMTENYLHLSAQDLKQVIDVQTEILG